MGKGLGRLRAGQWNKSGLGEEAVFIAEGTLTAQ